MFVAAPGWLVENHMVGHRKKPPIYTFSGAPSIEPGALQDALAAATSVEITRGGYLIHAVNRDHDVLADETEKQVDVMRREDGPVVTDPAAVAELVDALRVAKLTDFLCMCTGDLAAEFFDDDGRLIGVVRIDLPDSIEWPHWEGKAKLVDPGRLERWFARHWEASPVADAPAVAQHPMLPYLVDLETKFDAEARRPYDPADLIRYALTTTAYWAGLAIGWLETTEIPVGSLSNELEDLEGRAYWPQELRHRSRRVRMLVP